MQHDHPKRRLIVVGAGPIGIAAAIGARDRGFDVTVLERGEVGASLRTWGATRFFSPLHMNVTPRMRELLGTIDDDALLTGAEYADRILVPLARQLDVRTHTRVVAIGRRGLTRGDYAGHPLRAERPFRVVVESWPVVRGPLPEEGFLEAPIVLDASGGLIVPRAIGAGGLPARGESTVPAIRTLGELDARREELRGKRVLLAGNGHSAANAIAMLATMACEVTWAFRTPNRRPCEEVANDPLPERQSIVERANAFAEHPPAWLRIERRAMIEALAQNNGHVHVALTGGRSVEADVIAAFTGYRPDASFLGELAVETSPVTEGGARLYRAISSITDCLSVPMVKKHDLESGEPGFYFAGSRSYGRSRTFLLQNGFAQLETILGGLQ